MCRFDQHCDIADRVFKIGDLCQPIIHYRCLNVDEPGSDTYDGIAVTTINQGRIMKISSLFLLVLGASAFYSAQARELAEAPRPKSVVEIQSLAKARVPVSDAATGFVPYISRSADVTPRAAWAGSAVGPTMYQRGLWYTGGVINPIAGINSTTSVVYYTWSASYRPAGLLVYLCNYARCVDVSNFQSAGTTAFAGDDAYSQFAFRFGVIGTGLLNRVVYGSSNQVIVNYD